MAGEPSLEISVASQRHGLHQVDQNQNDSGLSVNNSEMIKPKSPPWPSMRRRWKTQEIQTWIGLTRQHRGFKKSLRARSRPGRKDDLRKRSENQPDATFRDVPHTSCAT